MVRMLALLMACSTALAGYDEGILHKYPEPPGGPLTYARLRQLIEKNNVDSIDTLLPLLPEEYRKHYTLVYQSRSLQHADAANPRVVMYGPRGELMITFSGKPGSRGFNRLETTEWDPKTESFVYREIRFSEPKTDGAKSKPRFDEHPGNCVICHGEPPRPNWDSYNFWPGVYGSLARQDFASIEKGKQEDRNYQLYLANRDSGRYRFLPKPPKELESKPVPAERSTPTSDGYFSVTLDGANPDVYIFANGATTNPNDDITAHIVRLNLKRIWRAIRTAPLYDKYKYALAALALDCKSALKPWDYSQGMPDPSEKQIETFFPAKVQKAGRSYDEIYSDLKTVSDREYEIRRGRLDGFNSGAKDERNRYPIEFNFNFGRGSTQDGDQLTALKYMTDRMGLSMEYWSTGFDQGTYAFSGPIGGLDRLFRDPLFKDLLVPAGSNPTKDLKATCEKLKAKSLAALADGEGDTRNSGVAQCTQPPVGLEALDKAARDCGKVTATDNPPAPRRPRILATCVACHTGPETEGPAMPFDNPAKLDSATRQKISERLRSGDEKRRMPYDMPALSTTEIEDVENYLKSVAR